MSPLLRQLFQHPGEDPLMGLSTSISAAAYAEIVTWSGVFSSSPMDRNCRRVRVNPASRHAIAAFAIQTFEETDPS